MKKVVFVSICIATVLILIFVLVPGAPLNQPPISIGIDCETAPVNGPKMVPETHILVTITENSAMKNQWIAIIGPKSVNLVSYADKTTKKDKIVFHGWVGDVRGGETMIFDPGEYTFLVLQHSKDKDYPDFQEADVKYETTVAIGQCN